MERLDSVEDTTMTFNKLIVRHLAINQSKIVTEQKLGIRNFYTALMVT